MPDFRDLREAPGASVPVHEPALTSGEEARLLEAFRSGWISGRGPHVGLFEDALSRRFPGQRACAVSSGTAALHLALKALNVGPGDEVIIPDLTYIAVASAVIYCGAVPVPCDVRPEYWNLDPEAVARALTPRTAAIIAVHGFGHPADMPALTRLAAERGIPVVEDVSQAFGAECAGAPVGTLGAVSTHSFFANKILTTGEGGAVTTADAGLRERLDLLRNHCEMAGKKYEHSEVGYNYRMGNLQAALGLSQLERLDEIFAARRRVLDLYREELGALEGARLNPREPWAEPVNWMVCLEAVDGWAEAVRARLARANIEVREAFPPLSRQPALSHLPARSNPVAERLSRSMLMLPSGSGLNREAIARVCGAVRKAFR